MSGHTPRWYMLNKFDMATLCKDQQDADDLVVRCDAEWQNMAPHKAVLLMDAESLSMVWGALGACRDAIPVPPIGDANEHLWQQAMQEPKAVPDFVRASVAHLTAQRDELLAALKELMHEVGFGRIVFDTTASTKARAAIAKVEP